MDVRGRWVLLCVAMVVGCSIGLVPIAAGDGFVATDHAGAETQLQEAPEEETVLEDADEIHIDVFINENGSATFSVDYRYAIDENRSADEWAEIQTEVDDNAAAYATAEADRWDETLADARAETDREMELSNVSVSTDTTTAPRERGHVEFTFEWSSFAHVELNRIEAGDALADFTLPEDTALQFRWPEQYALYEEPDPSPDDANENSVFWDDEGSEFGSDQPTVVLIENAADGTERDETDDGPPMPWLVVVGALLVLATVGAAGWWIRGEQLRTQGSAADAASTGTDHTGGSDGPPPDLLSNEERVLRLLEQRGGRIKQQEVVSELEWTEAKTSQVVSGLRQDEEIEVFRIGRENVLALPDDTDHRP